MKQNYTPVPRDTEPKLLGIFTKDRDFYRSFFSLLIVIALQQLASLAVNLVDNVMLGRYTELALSGATLVNQLQFVLQQVSTGIGMGVVVLGSQYWGRRQLEPIRKIISLGLKLGFIIGLLFFLCAKLAPRQLLGLFTDDTAVIEEGLKYLRIMCWTYLVYSISNSLVYAMQAVETAFVGTLMSVSTICINLCLNYIFIYGHFGAPELGIYGAAVATLVSRAVELVIILVYILRFDRKLTMKPGDLLQFNWEYLKDYISVATPVIMSGFLWGIAQGAQTVILGHISQPVIAANSIASVVFQLFVCFGYACVNVASIIMGKTVGEGKIHKIRPYSKTMQGLFVILGIFSCLTIMLSKNAIISIYAVSEETKQLASGFLTVMAITSVGTCYEFPVESGIIAGGGSTRYAPLMDNLFMWLFTIPASALSAFVFNMPPIVTFSLLKADQILKCVPNAIKCNRYRWVKVLTRDE